MAKESMKDMEKQVIEDNSKHALLPPVQVMTGGKEQDPLILVDAGCINLVEGCGGFAAKMKLGLKNWRWRLPYGLVAGSVIVMTNNIHTAPKLIPPELAVFALFLCGTGLVFHAMKN